MSTSSLFSSVVRGVGIRALCLHCSRQYALYAKPPYLHKHVSLAQQSVLLPGKERIRSSALLEDPNELVWKIPESEDLQTAYSLLDHGLQVSGDGDCVGSRTSPGGEYRWLKYSEVTSRSQHVGAGLQDLGLKPSTETLVGIYASNREEFLLSMCACAAYSMVSVPIYLQMSLQSVFFIINQASLQVVVVNSNENAVKVLKNAKEVPSLRTIVMMDDVHPETAEAAQGTNIALVSYAELEARGRSNPKPLVLPKPDDLFCIPYTSGTTGVPKGVMLTHKNLIACVAALRIGYGEAGKFGGTIISYLPPAHIYEIANQIVSLYFARRIAFYAGDVKKLLDEVRFVKPDILPLVPRLMNPLYSKALENIKGSFLKSTLLNKALSRKEKLIQMGKRKGLTLYDKLVFKDFRQTMGGNMHMVITTSAPVSAEVMRFFRRASGAYLIECYGQTEMMGATMTLPHEINGGMVGPPLPCNYMKLVDVPEMGYFAKDDVGEICMKGHNVFKGYFKNEEATKESLIDGWQHTGDIGKWLPNGALKIIDRKKHLFKLSQGEYIAPEKIESAYSHSELVAQIFVDGLSHQNYVVALVVPEINGLQKWLKGKGYTDTSNLPSLLSNKEVKKEFLLELHKVGQREDLISLEQARSLAFLTEPFTVANDLMTPTMKVKRNRARKVHERLIAQLYEEGPLL